MIEVKDKQDLSLFNLTGEYLALFEMDYPEIYEDDSEEVKAEKLKDQMAFDELLSDILMAMDSKADGYCYVRQRWMADIEAAKAEKKNMEAVIKRKENNIKRMEARLYNSMKISGRTNIETALHSLSIKPKRPTVQILIPEEEIPQEYQKIKTEISADKVKIRDAIKNGKKIDFAVYESAGDELKIK
jgi:hypothetical protein